MAEKPTAVEKLMQYMDACCLARGAASFTQGYRARFEADMKRMSLGADDEAEAKRLYEKEKNQWKYCAVVEARFRSAAQRLLREARKEGTTPKATLRRRGSREKA